MDDPVYTHYTYRVNKKSLDHFKNDLKMQKKIKNS